jgi:hypothetical protein
VKRGQAEAVLRKGYKLPRALLVGNIDVDAYDLAARYPGIGPLGMTRGPIVKVAFRRGDMAQFAPCCQEHLLPARWERVVSIIQQPKPQAERRAQIAFHVPNYRLC